MNLWIIFRDGEYFGTARDEEAARRDVGDNIDWLSPAGWDRFAIVEYSPCGEVITPRPR